MMCTATLDNLTRSGIGSGTTAQAPASPSTAAAKPVPIPMELLDGGEVVILAIKPSLWFVVFDSFKWLAAGLVVLAGATLAGGPLEWVSYPVLLQTTVVAVMARLGVALLRWVSRFYLLTNRRILRIQGVLRAQILDIALIRILHTRVTVAWHEGRAGLGTIRFASQPPAPPETAWVHVRDAEQVHAQVRRTIERALDRQQVT